MPNLHKSATFNNNKRMDRPPPWRQTSASKDEVAGNVEEVIEVEEEDAMKLSQLVALMQNSLSARKPYSHSPFEKNIIVTCSQEFEKTCSNSFNFLVESKTSGNHELSKTHSSQGWLHQPEEDWRGWNGSCLEGYSL